MKKRKESWSARRDPYAGCGAKRLVLNHATYWPCRGTAPQHLDVRVCEGCTPIHAYKFTRYRSDQALETRSRG